MNKKTKLKLNETLDKALQPPKRKSQDGLSALLSQYTEELKPIETAITEQKPVIESLPSQSSHTRQTLDVSPTRNFSKVANSISKQAVPDGWFKGKSKQLYDTLYSLTRGAINPARNIRIQKSRLMKMADIGARNTLDSNIEHLKNIGLIIEIVFIGEHKGNEFEVLLPEEIIPESLTSLTSVTSQAKYAQKLDRLVTLETRQTRQSLKEVESNTYGKPNTLLKTNTNDDDATRIFSEKMNRTSERLTGKKLSKADAEKLGDLADLLILELEIAAKKTNGISSIPAFLTEVLRRKLRDASTTEKQSKAEINIIGKSEPDAYEIKPLDEQGRVAALIQLQEFAADDFLEDFKKWYTDDDWKWLTEQLKEK